MPDPRIDQTKPHALLDILVMAICAVICGVAMWGAWATRNHLMRGPCKGDARSNEITAIPNLLAVLDMAGCIGTLDAMGCQKAIARAIIEKAGDLGVGAEGKPCILVSRSGVVL